MAQPTKYERQNDFQDELGTAHGTALDDDFDTVRVSINETIDNIGLIQRDDGKLRNDSVHPDALDTATKALIASDWTPRGAWATATTYSVGDVVEQSEAAYVCAEQHVAGVFATDKAAGNWIILTGATIAQLGSTLPNEGASLVGIEDQSGRFVSDDVEGALGEVKTAAELASTANGKGASLIGIEDSAGKYSGSTVEAALAELNTAAALAASGGSALVGYIGTGTGATARTVQAKLRDAVSVKDFGATGDGTTDDAATLQAAATAATGGVLLIPPGNYKCAGTFAIPADTKVFGYGARLFDTATHRTLISLASGAELYGLEVEGAGNSAYSASGKLVDVSGTDGGAGVAPTYVERVKVRDCYLHGAGNAAIYSQYGRDCDFSYNIVEDIAYAAFQILSPVRVNTVGNRIVGVTPGVSGNAYGIAISNLDDADTVRYPHAQDCLCAFNHVEDIPLWEAYDTHGGDNIRFIGNTAKNVKTGVAIVESDDELGNFVRGPSRCVVSNNIIVGNNTGMGIVVSGETGFEAIDCAVIGNILDSCGTAGDNITGAIGLKSTQGIAVGGNRIKNASPFGICLIADNYGFSITGNVAVDCHDASVTIPGMIAVRAGVAQGYIGGNTLTTENAALDTYVNVRGIQFSTSTDVDISWGANFLEATAPYSGVDSTASRNRPNTQSGTASVNTNTGAAVVTVNVTFPEPFSIAPTVVPGYVSGSGIGSVFPVVGVSSVTTTGCTLTLATPDGTNFASAVARTLSWVANGY